MKPLLLANVMSLVAALAGCAVTTPNQCEDVNGDGEATFYDLERRQKPTVAYDPPVDFERQFGIHMDRQRSDYRQRVREGKAFEE
jgi:hypothetical protein